LPVALRRQAFEHERARLTGEFCGTRICRQGTLLTNFTGSKLANKTEQIKKKMVENQLP